MNLANRIAQWREQSPEQWAGMAARYLAPAASVALAVAIAFQLAQLTWRLIPNAPLEEPPPVVSPAPARSAGATAGPTFDTAGIVSAHLFGEAPAERAAPAVETIVDAPDTTLSLRLTGVQAHPAPDRGQAIIANGRNEEKAYRIGDVIDGGNGAELHAVYSDRVILNRSGSLEALRLPKEVAGRAASSAAAARAMTPAASAGAGSLREAISENASRITEIVRIAPHVEGGQMVGFRVNPGRDRERFNALGLQPGDVVTDINGTLLDDPSRGLEVFEALGEATQANVTVLREGVPEVLVIDTSQLESLAEGRQ